MVKKLADSRVSVTSMVVCDGGFRHPKLLLINESKTPRSRKT